MEKKENTQLDMMSDRFPFITREPQMEQGNLFTLSDTNRVGKLLHMPLTIQL